MARSARASAPRLARAQPLVLHDPPVRRDFDAVRELVWHRDGQRFVVRERQGPREGGAHVYTAYELADVGFYGVAAEGLGPAVVRPFGRVDTLKPPRAFDPISEYTEVIGWLLDQQRRARALINELCPETIHVLGDAVYDGPGYVTMLSRPAARYAAHLAARRPS